MALSLEGLALFAQIRIRRERSSDNSRRENKPSTVTGSPFGPAKRAWRRKAANGFDWEPVKNGPSTGDEQQREQHPPADPQAKSLPRAKTKAKANRTGPGLKEDVCGSEVSVRGRECKCRCQCVGVGRRTLEVRQRQKSTPSLLVLCCCLLVLKARSTECAKRTTTAADTAAPHTHPPGQGGGGGNFRGEAPRKCHLNSSSNRRYVDNIHAFRGPLPHLRGCARIYAALVT